MIFWIVLAVFLIPLIYLINTHFDEKRDRDDELKRIRRRLAEKEAENAADSEGSER